MLKKITGYFGRRQQAKLIKQWVKHDDLILEETQPKVPNRGSEKETELARDDIKQEEVPGYIAPINVDRGMIRLPFRYVLLGLFIIGLLLVALSVVSTILITRSC